jgi:DNA-binding beta-propeller fold protein YncE
MRHSQGLRAAGGEVGWNLADATFNGIPLNFSSVQEQEASPSGLFFKSDGTKMYICGSSSDTVYEYDLSTAWDVSTTSLLQSFSIGAQDSQPRELFFKGDGTKMYVMGSATDSVYEYTLSTAWNVTTASYVQAFSVTAKDSNPHGLYFKDDGTKMYVCGAGSSSVHEYALSTAWNISTATFSQSYSVGSQTSIGRGLFFKDDGTKMYVQGSTTVYSYNLSTAWNISTSSVSTSSSAAGFSGSYGIFFKPDGTKFFNVNPTSDDVKQYGVSTAWDISTSSFTYPSNEYFSVATKETDPTGVVFKTDGTKMYVIGFASDAVHEYSLSTAWSISSATFTQSFSVVTEETSPSALAFKPDGTKMYVIGSIGDDVNEYSLSSAWNISTATYVQNFSVATQEGIPNGLAFSTDGANMYVIGQNNSTVYQYALSSAWNISTASLTSSYSALTQDSVTIGLTFKPDGTKMFIAGSGNDRVYEYTLATAWAVSTASYVRFLNVAHYDTAISDLTFNNDGTKLYIIGTGNDAVWSFDL